MNFDSAAGLETWLNENSIDTSTWGTGESKTAVDLWHEIQNGETVLHSRPPERVVRVVQIIIRQDDKVLLEVEQELRDGRKRSRNLLPSDKMLPDETPKETAVRCLQEELGVLPDQIVSLTEVEQRQTRQDSASYPGLVSRYQFIIFETAVTNLPPDNFWRENKVDADADPVKRHHWAWVDGDQYP